MRTQPVPWFTICSMRPLRSASSWVTTPRVVLGDVDGDVLDRFVDLAVHLAGDDLGLAHG